MVSGCVIGRYKNRRTPQDAWKSVMRCRAVFIHTMRHSISQLQSRVTFTRAFVCRNQFARHRHAFISSWNFC